MPQRIDLGRVLLAIGAVLLLVSLFLEWYDTGPNGWQVFEALDLVLFALAAAALAIALRPDAAPPYATWAVPLAVVFIVAVQLIDVPPASGDGDPAVGAWLALGAGLLMASGSALSLTSISVTVQVRERDLRRRVAAVDRREAAMDRRDEAEAQPGAEPRRSSGSSLFGSDPASPGDPVPPPPSSDPDRTQPLSAITDDEPPPRSPDVSDPPPRP